MAKRAVLYARVSSDDRGNEGRNLEGQLEMGREYAQENGWEVVAELAEDDRGASGADIDLPQLTKIREMADDGEFDIVVVRELDRLSRDLAKQLVVEQELTQAGVEIKYVLHDYPDTIEGKLMKNIRAVVAEYERLKIEERMTRGRRQKVKAGNVMVHGRPPYGYNEVERDGRTTLAIDEEEACVVRMIFRWYTVGEGSSGPMSMYAITKRLSEKCIPTKGDKDPAVQKQKGYGQWSRSSVARMLHREAYAGTWYYGKDRGGRQNRNPDEYWIPLEVPAIVDRSVWEAAQERLDKNKATAKRNTKHEYLLRRQLTCGDCGAKMAARYQYNKGEGGNGYYYCPVPYDPVGFAKDCDLRGSFRVDEVDSVVWDWVKTFLTDRSALTDAVRAQQERLEDSSLHDELSTVDDQLADKREELHKLLDLYLTGQFPEEVLAERKEKVQKAVQTLERRRKKLKEQLQARAAVDERIASLEDVTEQVAQALNEADQDFEVRRGITELLDVEVTLTREDGHDVAYARCLIGEELLSIASTSS